MNTDACTQREERERVKQKSRFVRAKHTLISCRFNIELAALSQFAAFNKVSFAAEGPPKVDVKRLRFFLLAVRRFPVVPNENNIRDIR